MTYLHCFLQYLINLVVRQVESPHVPHGPEHVGLDALEPVVREAEPPQHGVAGEGVAPEILHIVVGHVEPRQLREVLWEKGLCCLHTFLECVNFC